MTNRSDTGVVLPTGHTGSSLFHAVLAEAVARFPSVLKQARFPSDAATFKRDYGLALARFEAARVGAPERVEIARFILQRTQQELRFGSPDAGVPLSDCLREHVATPQLERRSLPGKSRRPLELPFEGRVYRGRDIHGVIEQLFESQALTAAARLGLKWAVDHALEQGGAFDLSGQRFVLFGAGAELASTRLLLQAGARVLWVDLSDPSRTLTRVDELAGEISYAPDASNLLTQPREIAAAVRAFAADGPVHVGMFAYAPGASKEWRLGVAMNAIVSSLEPSLIASVSLLISPTTASVLTPESVRAAELRHLQSPGWQRLMERVGLLERPGHVRAGDVHVARATVSLQGLSYQAAQYISKIAAAETYAVYGTSERNEELRPTTVSANVAGVTRTRSLSHPLFNAAFVGAERFGVRIFDAETTRALNGMLMLHDLLNPQAPGASAVTAKPREKAAALLAQQIHGGIYCLPYVVEPVIRAAAVAGLASQPSLLFQKRPAAPASLASSAPLSPAPAE